MRRANNIRRFMAIGALAVIFRKRWVRSKAVNPFLISGHRSNTPLVLVLLSVAGVLSGCSHESRISSQPPRAVRLVTVAAPQTSAETLRYSASILPYTQPHLLLRSSGSLTHFS